MHRFSRSSSWPLLMALALCVPAYGSSNPTSKKTSDPGKSTCSTTAVTVVSARENLEGSMEVVHVTSSGTGMTEVRRGVWTYALSEVETAKQKPPALVAKKRSRGGVSKRNRRKPAATTPAKPKPNSQPFVELLGADPENGG